MKKVSILTLGVYVLLGMPTHSHTAAEHRAPDILDIFRTMQAGDFALALQLIPEKGINYDLLPLGYKGIYDACKQMARVNNHTAILNRFDGLKIDEPAHQSSDIDPLSLLSFGVQKWVNELEKAVQSNDVKSVRMLTSHDRNINELSFGARSKLNSLIRYAMQHNLTDIPPLLNRIGIIHDGPLVSGIIIFQGEKIEIPSQKWLNTLETAIKKNDTNATLCLLPSTISHNNLPANIKEYVMQKPIHAIMEQQAKTIVISAIASRNLEIIRIILATGLHKNYDKKELLEKANNTGALSMLINAGIDISLEELNQLKKQNSMLHALIISILEQNEQVVDNHLAECLPKVVADLAHDYLGHHPLYEKPAKQEAPRHADKQAAAAMPAHATAPAKRVMPSHAMAQQAARTHAVTPRLSSRAVAMEIEDEVNGVACSACTFINDLSAPACTLCGTRF